MTGAELRTLDQPGHRAPAPGGLRLVQAFLNTADLEGGTDDLGDREGLGGWLERWGLTNRDVVVSEGDHRHAVAVREALRDVIAARDSGRDATAAATVLRQAGQRAHLFVSVSADGMLALQATDPGIDGAIARILSEASSAVVQGTWRRLKICGNDVCRWAFYDASRNRSGVWCSMAVCGNRVKGRAFRARHARRLTSSDTVAARSGVHE